MIITVKQCKELFQKLYDFSKEVDFIVKITEAQHYRRFVIEQEKKNNKSEETKLDDLKIPNRLTRDFGPGGSIGHAPKGVNAGKGYVFISHTGEIYPSGFLPLTTGDVRRDSLTNIYRDHPIFQLLRNHEYLLGKCGICEYKTICGGSRSRAYAMNGNLMSSEPLCIYKPQKETVLN